MKTNNLGQKQYTADEGFEIFDRQRYERNKNIALTIEQLSKIKYFEDKFGKVPLYFWYTKTSEGKKHLMTAAFRWRGKPYGLSYDVPSDTREEWRAKNKLCTCIRESLDALFHHGDSIVDNSMNIDPRKVLEQEKNRYCLDPDWAYKVAALNKCIKVVEIDEDKARKLMLL